MFRFDLLKRKLKGYQNDEKFTLFICDSSRHRLTCSSRWSMAGKLIKIWLQIGHVASFCSIFEMIPSRHSLIGSTFMGTGCMVTFKRFVVEIKSSSSSSISRGVFFLGERSFGTVGFGIFSFDELIRRKRKVSWQEMNEEHELCWLFHGEFINKIIIPFVILIDIFSDECLLLLLKILLSFT